MAGTPLPTANGALPFRVLDGPPRRPWLGLLSIALSFVIMAAVTFGSLLAFVLLVAIASGLLQEAGSAGVEAMGLAALVGFVIVMLASLRAFPLSVRLLEGGLRMAAPRHGDAWLRRLRAPPVLLLRQFRDDELRGAWMPQFLIFSANRWEDRLAAALRAAGPVVALGHPGERLPPRGAARLYVHDDDWKEAIRYFLARSALVVIILGRGSSLWWEIAEALRRVPPERLLLAFPLAMPSIEEWQKQARGLRRWLFLPGFPPRRDLALAKTERRERYALIRDRLTSSFPRGLPRDIDEHEFLAFDADWNPFFLEERQDWWWYATLPIVGLFRKRETEISFRRTLRPIVQRCRVSVPRP